jgi:ABC-type microcin C transport system duplicated ATPase subunit YejF
LASDLAGRRVDVIAALDPAAARNAEGRLGMGYLFVTNDLNVVRLLCDRSVIAVSLRGAAGDEAILSVRHSA